VAPPEDKNLTAQARYMMTLSHDLSAFLVKYKSFSKGKVPHRRATPRALKPL
jgi:hypothetical protein